MLRRSPDRIVIQLCKLAGVVLAITTACCASVSTSNPATGATVALKITVQQPNPLEPGSTFNVLVSERFDDSSHGLQPPGILTLTPLGGGAVINLGQYSWPPLLWHVRLPISVVPGKYHVTLKVGDFAFGAPGILLVSTPSPVITGPSGILASPGLQVTLSGINFGQREGAGYIAFEPTLGQSDAPPTPSPISAAGIPNGRSGWTNTEISFKVPTSDIGVGEYNVTVHTDSGLTSNPDELAIDASNCSTLNESVPIPAPNSRNQAFFLSFAASTTQPEPAHAVLTTVASTTGQPTASTPVGPLIPFTQDGVPAASAVFAPNPAGTRVYVAITAPDLGDFGPDGTPSDGTLFTVNTDPQSSQDNQIVSSTALGIDPTAITVSPDGSAVWVANQQAINTRNPNNTSGTIVKFNADGGLIQTFSLDTLATDPSVQFSPTLLAANNNGDLFVAGEAANISSATQGGFPPGPSTFGAMITESVIQSSSSSQQITPMYLPGGIPTGLAFSPLGPYLYESTYLGSYNMQPASDATINTLDTATLAVINQTDVGATAVDLVSSQDGKTLYTLNSGSDQVNVATVSDGGQTVTSSRAIPVTLPFLYQATPGHQSNAIPSYFFGTLTRQLFSEWGYLGTESMALEPTSNTLLITYGAASQALTVNLANGMSSAIQFPYVTGETTFPDGQLPLVVVSNSNGQSVSVINPFSNSVVATTQLGVNPKWLTVTPDGERIVASYNDSGRAGLASMDVGDFDVDWERDVSLGNAGPIQAAGVGDETVEATSSGQVGSTSVSWLLDASDVAVSPQNSSMFLSPSSYLDATALPPGKIAASATDPDRSCAYVVESTSDTALPVSAGDYLQEINIPTQQAGLPFTDGGEIPAGVAVSPGDNVIYVADYQGGTVKTLDAKSDTVLGSTLLGPVQPDAIVAGDTVNGPRVFVSESGISPLDGSSNVAELTPTSSGLSFDTLIPINGEPSSLALNSSGTTLYVVDEASNQVDVIDLASNSPVVEDTIRLGEGPLILPSTPPRALERGLGPESLAFRIRPLHTLC